VDLGLLCQARSPNSLKVVVRKSEGRVGGLWSPGPPFLVPGLSTFEILRHWFKMKSEVAL
jgi:hypothetical protein